VFRNLATWFEDRTQISKLCSLMLIEHIPGGAKWRYVWGSCLSFVFAIQLITGVLLMTAYSPGSSTAWGSVFYIQYEMDFGWLIRGLHHFGSQTMVVLLALHMLQVVIAGAHLPPREINWWLGLLLLGVVLALSLTGYLLPWDQKGFWATQVATNILATTPIIGPGLRQIVIGGTEFGNATLTRFFALHVAILPGLLIVLVIAHLAVFRRQGVTYPKEAQGEGWFWPDQAFRDMLVCLAIFGGMLFLVFNGHGHHVEDPQAVAGEEVSMYDDWAKAGRKGLGANLDAPADAADEYEARPEWYFLFLFQLLKYFEGEQALIGTQVIPSGVALVLLLLPLLAFGRKRNPNGPDPAPVRFAQIIGVIVVTGLITAICTLTCLALAADQPDPVQHGLLKYVGLYVIPLVALVFLLHVGITGAISPGLGRSIVAMFGIIVLTVLVLGTGGLIYSALSNNIPDQVGEKVVERMEEEKSLQEQALKKKGDKTEWAKALIKAEQFQAGQALAATKAKRALQLAMSRIPVEGPVTLVRNDPVLQFKGLFKSNCASCHSYGEFSKDAPWKTTDLAEFKENPVFTASDLYGFGTEEWIYEFLKNPGTDQFYGRTTKDGDVAFSRMTDWATDPEPRSGAFQIAKRLLKEDPDNPKEEPTDEEVKVKLNDDFRAIASWLAQHPTDNDWDKKEEGKFARGYDLFLNEKKYNCTRCHGYEDAPVGTGPDLTGYGGQLWLHRMIRKPAHEDMYGRKNLMPSFWPEGGNDVLIEKLEYLHQPGGSQSNFAALANIEIEMIVRHLTGDDRLVFGGRPITAVKKKDEK
jgi:quinol-cytochrome oxidoreductase complex cytochrome b subunit/mono/diheme cytochrome c family protein